MPARWRAVKRVERRRVWRRQHASAGAARRAALVERMAHSVGRDELVVSPAGRAGQREHAAEEGLVELEVAVVDHEQQHGRPRCSRARRGRTRCVDTVPWGV
eukprot:1529754-Prymnesium_polylepis.1